jgi:phosphoglycolate phosphatase
MRYDAVIFDNDGVLIEPTDLSVSRRSTARTLREFGVESPAEEHITALIGGGIDAIREVTERYSLEVTEFWERREYNSFLDQRDEMTQGNKSVFDDADVVASIDCECAVVSNNQHRTVEFALEHFGLNRYVSAYFGREPSLAGVGRMKPDPYYVDRAIEELSVDNALFVGDSTVDIEVARRAGLDSVFLQRPNRVVHDFDNKPTDATPTYTIRGLDELLSLLTE